MVLTNHMLSSSLQTHLVAPTREDLCCSTVAEEPPPPPSPSSSPPPPSPLSPSSGTAIHRAPRRLPDRPQGTLPPIRRILLRCHCRCAVAPLFVAAAAHIVELPPLLPVTP
ncbi:hypothetical protein Syun_007298 [Stephania yunnanensis]|uniref:Uncharacterized protein n=1 Tax=Stephania yunnanensis TaxID=152371 RepID=A0AAP0PYE3_9MAGN